MEMQTLLSGTDTPFMILPFNYIIKFFKNHLFLLRFFFFISAEKIGGMEVEITSYLRNIIEQSNKVKTVLKMFVCFIYFFFILFQNMIFGNTVFHLWVLKLTVSKIEQPFWNSEALEAINIFKFNFSTPFSPEVIRCKSFIVLVFYIKKLSVTDFFTLLTFVLLVWKYEFSKCQDV